MAEKTKTSYIDFEPYCEWKKEEGTHTLLLHVFGFKKDQLRVQVNNQGLLKVSGERPLDGTHTSRFLKESKIPEDCDMNDIRAKFTNGHLHVIMPKRVQQANPKATTSSDVSQEPEAQQASPPPDDQKLNGPSTDDSRTGTMVSCDQAKNPMMGLENCIARFHVGKKVAVSFGMAIAAMIGIGAYAGYKFGSEYSCSSSSSDTSSAASTHMET